MKLHEESAFYKKQLDETGYAIGYFWGQTFLYVSKEKLKHISVDGIYSLIEQIFGLTERFGLCDGECVASYFFELPPIKGYPENKGKEKVLIELIERCI